LHFDALIAAAIAEQEFSLPASIAYLENAVLFADVSDDLGSAARFSARAELAIALLLNGDDERAMTHWDEAGGMLVTPDVADDPVKGRITLFLQHSSYFYVVARGLLAEVHRMPLEHRPVTPMIGQFHAEWGDYGRHLDAYWPARLSVMLGRIAEVRGLILRAKNLGTTALVSINSLGDTPSILKDEAERLASLAEI
jgi:hypothetical protein